LPVVGWTLN